MFKLIVLLLLLWNKQDYRYSQVASELDVWKPSPQSLEPCAEGEFLCKVLVGISSNGRVILIVIESFWSYFLFLGALEKKSTIERHVIQVYHDPINIKKKKNKLKKITIKQMHNEKRMTVVCS